MNLYYIVDTFGKLPARTVEGLKAARTERARLNHKHNTHARFWVRKKP